MNYRYQEMLSWIIPGFYFITLGIISISYLHPIDKDVLEGWISVIKDNDISNSLSVILVFLIPIISLIVGWIINALSARLFYLHCIQYKQVTYGKLAVYKNEKKKYDKLSLIRKKSKQKKYFREYCDAKQELNLDLVDRTYYRYVFSRNMFSSQLLISLLWLLGSIFNHQDCCVTIWGTIIMLALSAFYYFIIVDRDLASHAKFVFAEYHKLENKNN